MDVKTTRFRNLIPVSQRSWGMKVRVYADTATTNGEYVLVYGYSSTKKRDNSNWVKSDEVGRVVLATDVTNNNASADTIANVTGLSFSVKSGHTYKFRFQIVYTSAATTTGSRWSIDGPATPTALHYQSQYSLTTTSQTINTGLSAYDLPAAANATSAATASNIAIVQGIITPSADGTVIARFASEVTSSAIVAKAGLSYLEWEEIF